MAVTLKKIEKKPRHSYTRWGEVFDEFLDSGESIMELSDPGRGATSIFNASKVHLKRSGLHDVDIVYIDSKVYVIRPSKYYKEV